MINPTINRNQKLIQGLLDKIVKVDLIFKNKNDLIFFVVKEILRLTEENKYCFCRSNFSIAHYYCRDKIFSYYLYTSTSCMFLNEHEIACFLSSAAEKMSVKKMEAQYYGFAKKLFKEFCLSANFQKKTPLELIKLMKLET